MKGGTLSPWFGIIIVLNSQMGIITPPVGINVYVVSGISGISLPIVFKGVMPLLMAMIKGTGLFIVWLKIITFLPEFVN